MNGLKLPEKFFGNTVKEKNVFTIKKDIYNNTMDAVKKRIDALFSVCSEDKQKKILDRKPNVNCINNTFYDYYKGVKLPILDKTKMILDGISYIPVMQIVDTEVHSQSLGQYIVVKNNLRFCMVKMPGDSAVVMSRTSICPLLIFLLYRYNMDYEKAILDLGYELAENDIDAKYYIPYLDDTTNQLKIIRVKGYEEGKWKDYLLNPFIVENLALHKMALEKYRDFLSSLAGDNIVDKFEREEKIEKGLKEINNNNRNIEDEQARLEREISDTEEDRLNAIKLTHLVCFYYQISGGKGKAITKSGKSKGIKKWHVLNTIRKLNTKDITMNNSSILGIIQSMVKGDYELPQATVMSDFSQKMIRYFEWYALKLSSVRSFPDENMFSELCKIEQKLTYDNCTNIISELALLHRFISYGKGASPRESLGPVARNHHASHFGIEDPIHTSSGGNVMVVNHLVPEIRSFILREAIADVPNTDIFADVIDAAQESQETQERS